MIQKILGANGAEDYKDVTENQLVSDQQEREIPGLCQAGRKLMAGH